MVAFVDKPSSRKRSFSPAAYDEAPQSEDGSFVEDNTTRRAAKAGRPKGGFFSQYSPYGRLLRAEGPMAQKNPFRFSTKYTDDETGLVYYGFRYYSPSLGRFINRDPIEEQGGLNLYAAFANDPINHIDYLGMYDMGPEDLSAIADAGFLFDPFLGRNDDPEREEPKREVVPGDPWDKWLPELVNGRFNGWVRNPDYEKWREGIESGKRAAEHTVNRPGGSDGYVVPIGPQPRVEMSAPVIKKVGHDDSIVGFDSWHTDTTFNKSDIGLLLVSALPVSYTYLASTTIGRLAMDLIGLSALIADPDDPLNWTGFGSLDDVAKFADEITALNKATDGGGKLMGNTSPLTALQSASYYDNAAEQGAAIFQSISHGHMFVNGNKRTAVNAFKSFAKKAGLNINHTDDQLMDIATRVATGELSDVSEIAKALLP